MTYQEFARRLSWIASIVAEESAETLDVQFALSNPIDSQKVLNFTEELGDWIRSLTRDAL